MRPVVPVITALGLAICTSTAVADPDAIAPKVGAVPPSASTLIAAAVAAGDWRLHPEPSAALPWSATALLSIDVRGVRAGRRNLGIAAAGIALVGALLIASERKGSWCRGARCELGEAALLVAGPLIDAAVGGESDR